MKATELKKALELVKPGLAKRELIDQSTNVSFKNHLIFTFNDEVAVVAPIELDIEGSIPADPLYSFLSKLDSESECTIIITENEFKINSGRNRAGIRMDPEIRLPITEEVSEPESWHELPEKFLESLRTVQFTASRSGHLPILTCVNITDYFLQTFDEFRITRSFCRTEFRDNGDAPLSMNIVAKNLEKLPGYQPTEIGFTQNWAHFRNKDGVRYCCRIVDGEYPNLDRFMEQEGMELELPTELESALDWASVITDNTIQYEQEVEVHIKKGSLTVRGQGPDGWAEQEMRMKYKGEPVQFKAHPTFLKEMSKLTKKIIINDEVLKVETEGFVHLIALSED